MNKRRRADLAEQLRRVILESGQTLTAIARGSGVDLGVVSRFTRGERDVTMVTGGKIARYLGLELRPTRRLRTRK